MTLTIKCVSNTTQTLSTPVQQIGSMDRRSVVQIDISVARQGFKAGGDLDGLEPLVKPVAVVVGSLFSGIFQMAVGGGLAIGTIVATIAVGITTGDLSKALATFGVGFLLTIVVVNRMSSNIRSH